jgi:glycosyltransferase involved in cell wall biosynthesis
MYPSASDPSFGVFVAEQVEDLRALGVEMEVLAFDGRTHSIAYLGAAAEVRRRARSRFDLVHAHYGLSGAVALAQRRLQVVTTFHGSDAGYVAWQLRLSRAVARRSEPVVVAQALAEPLKLANPTIIPAGVDIGRFRPRSDARAALGLDRDLHYVLFPGDRGNARKRSDLFDAAVAEAGRELATVRPIALGGLSRDEAALMLAAADVTLMTSDWEGAPVTVKESLACETPVVSVEVGDVSELVGGLPGCAIRDRDPHDLAEGVLQALNAGRSPVLRLRAEEFSRERMARRVLDVYERLLGVGR